MTGRHYTTVTKMVGNEEKKSDSIMFVIALS
jgi:hypothetical protein